MDLTDSAFLPEYESHESICFSNLLLQFQLVWTSYVIHPICVNADS